MNPETADAPNASGSLRTGQRWRGIRDGILVMGMPSWNVDYPFYSLMVVAGLAEAIGIPAWISDLNIRFYNLVSHSDKPLWSGENTSQWMPGGKIPIKLHERYGNEIEELILVAARERNYGMFLLSVNMSNRYFTTLAVKTLKTHFPDVPVVLGGVDCFPLEYGKRFLTESVSPDVICQGEAEDALPKFLKEYAASGRLPTDIPGFAGYSSSGFFDAGEPTPPSLKDLPLPSLSGIDFSEYRVPGDFPIFSSRGCVNRCNFCSESPNFKRFRTRPAEQTFAELMHVHGTASRHARQPTVHFADSLINGSIKELEKLCRLIIDSGISILWGGQAFFREEMTRELLSLMRTSGFISAFWGLESGSQEVIDRMRKNYRINIAKRIIRDCSQIGITSRLPLIVGFPGETTVNIAETSLFIDQHRDIAMFLDPSGCCVRPNSPIHDRYSDFGLLNNLYTDWSSEDGSNTFPVRATRRAILRAVLSGKEPLRPAIVAELEILGIEPKRDDVTREIDTFVDARKCLQALARNPDDVEALTEMAFLRFRTGQAEIAASCLERVMEIHPGGPEVRILRDIIAPGSDTPPLARGQQVEKLLASGEEKFSRGHISAAIKVFRWILEIDKTNSRALNDLGVVLWEGGDAVSAMETFQVALSFNPKDPDALANLARAAAATGRSNPQRPEAIA